MLAPRVLLLADVGASGGIVRNDGQLRDQQGREVKSVRYLGVAADMHVQFRTGGFSYEIFKPGLAGKLLVQRIDVQFDHADTLQNGWKEEGPATGNFNYYSANGHFNDVPVFGKVRYKNAWKGVDVVFYSDPQSGFKYELEVSDARLLANARFLFLGVDSLSVAPNGAEIAIYAGKEQLNDRIPRSYLRCGSEAEPVQVNWKKINNNTFGFELQNTSSCALVVDPVPSLRWASYLGGSGSDQALGITTAADGSVYICGRTASANIATTGSFQNQLAARSDAFLARLRPAGGSNARIWCTYYGGDSADAAFTIQADAFGHVYVAGQTFSTTNTSRLLFRPQVQTVHNGGSDAFIAKFNQNGRMIWSNFFGGNANEIARTLSLDRKGQPVIAGETFSHDTSLVHAAASGYTVEQSGYGGNGDAFILFLDTAGKRLYSTYWGGSAHDEALTVSVNAGDTLFLGGRTRSASLPHSINSIGSGYDGFVSSFLADGSALANRYFGGGGTDAVNGLFADTSGLAVAGTTSSTALGFLSGGHQGSLNRGVSTTASDAFLVTLTTSLTPRWGTYYGGDNDEQGVAVTRDGSGYYFLLGNTNSPNGTARAIATPGSLYPNRRGATDAFLAKFNAVGGRSWGTYYGSNKDEIVHGFARGKGGNLFLAGETASDTGISRGGFQNVFAGTADAFTAGLSVCPRFLRTKQGSGCINDSITLYSTLDSSLFVDNYSGSPYSWTKAFPSSFKISWTGPNSFSSSQQFPKFKARWADTGIYRLVVFNEYGCSDTSYLRISNFLSDKGVSWNNLKTVFCRWDTIKLEANVAGGALYTWRGPRNFRDTGSIMQRFPANADAEGKYYLEVRDSGGCVEMDSMMISVRPVFEAGSNTPVCPSDTISFSLRGPYNPKTVNWSGPLGFSSSQRNPLITLADSSRSGTYRVIVSDSLNCRDTFNVRVVVRPKLKVAITAPLNICRGARLDVRSRVVNAYGGYQYRWSGPASFSRLDSNFIINGITTSYTGNFNLRLTDAGGCAYDTGFALTVRLPASIAIQTDSQRSCANTNYVSLRSNTTLATGNGSITQSNWTLGDGSSFSGTGPFGKRYAGAGTYAVRLRVNTSFGCLDSSTQNLVVYAEPTAGFSLNASAQCLGANRFASTNTSSAGSGSLSYAWNFGDGTTSAQAQPVKRYTSTGNFNIQLVATNSFGCRDTLRRSVTVNPDPAASFTVNRDKQCLNNNHFVFGSTSTISSGSIQSHQWNFGGGLFSNAARDSFSYPDSGIYRVRLIVSSNLGCNDTQWQTVQVYPQAKPGFNWNGDQCLRGNSFSFTNTSAVGSGSINGYTWRFGNGSSSTAKDPTGVRYSSTGTYAVKLITRTSNQCFDSITRNVVVKAHPSAAFTVDFDSLCFRGNAFTFSGTGSSPVPGSGFASRRWLFGPDASRSTDTGALPATISYTTAGSKKVQLIATDRNGCSDTATRNVTVIRSVSAGFSANNSKQCLRGNSFVFSNGSSGATSYLWDFGDGTGANSSQPTKQYNAAGTYDVRLIAIGAGGCRDTLTRRMTVSGHPTAAFTANSTTQCIKGNRFVFTNNSTGANAASWSFGDANTSNTYSPVHVYAATGSYRVLLTARNTDGCTDTTSSGVMLQVSPTAAFSINNDKQCFKNHSFSLTNSSTGSGSLSYSWDFGDGSAISSAISPTKTYTTNGNYTIQLVTTNGIGCSDTLRRSITIYAQPQPAFSLNSQSQCFRGHRFTINNTTTGASSYTWDFGDGSAQSNATSPTKTYANTGNYRIFLTAVNGSNCRDTLSRWVNVYSSPTAGFGLNSNDQCLRGNRFVTSNTSSGSTSYQWDFGDGTTSTNATPIKSYNATGTYSIRQVVITSAGCRDTQTRSVTINAAPKASFTLNNDRQCRRGNFFIGNNASTGAATYLWDYGDGSTRSTSLNGGRIYTASGKYNMTLVATNSAGCKDTFSLPLTVDAQPVAAIGVNKASQCLWGHEFDFYGQSTVSNDSIVSNSWDFSNGVTSTLKNPNGIIYRSAGVYRIRLVSRSGSGCLDTAFRNVELLRHPTAQWSVNKDTQCFNGNGFVYTNSSVPVSGSYIRGFRWFFGSGSKPDSSNAQRPDTIKYTSTGTPRVTLIAMDQNGCSDTFFNFVRILGSPRAGWFVNDTDQCLAGNNFIFSATAIPAVGSQIRTWDWTFGTDASPATATAATNNQVSYSSFGRKYVTLTVTDRNGCRDSRTGSVIAYPQPSARFSVNSSRQCFKEHKVILKNNSYSPIPGLTYLWDMGDGTRFRAVDTVYRYAKHGTYTIKLLTQQAGGCNDSATTTVTILPSPKADFAVKNYCKMGLTLEFNSKSYYNPGMGYGNGLSFAWDFGNGITHNDQDTMIEFRSAGYYDVSLKVTTDSGCTDEIKKPVQAYEKLRAGISVNNRNGCGVKQIFTFTNQSRWATGNNVKFFWEPGDSIELGKTGKNQPIISNDTDIVHQYREPGGYKVRLIVVADDGCRDTAYETIQVFDIPIAGFALANPCSNTSVAVFNNTTVTKWGTVSYKWDLGDGGISTSTAPRHRYDSFGRYTVKLVARSSGGCMDSTTGMISIYPAPWIQTWDSTISDCQNNNLFYFKSRSGITGNSYLMHRWRLSDKTAATGFEFSKSFADSGQFMVIGTARAATGCEASDTVIVHVKPNPIAAFSMNDSDQCFKDNWFQFTNNSVSPGLGGGMNFLWEFGDGDTSTLKNAFHQYDTSGLLPVVLHVTNSYGCSTAIAKRVRIYEHPVADFMVNDSAQCLSNNRFDMSNLTVYYGGSGIANSFWEFGDSSSSTAHSPSHSYNIRGSYSVRLTVTSPYGCYDTASRSVHVWQNPDKPVIRVLRGIQCFGMLGALQATATGGQAPYTYLWNGNSRHRSNILDSIPASDYHLQIIDANGCESDASFTLTQPERMIDTINLVNHVRCFGETSGNAYVKALGGVPPYRFEWTSNGRTYFGEELYRVPAGEYKLLIKDMLGCSIRDSFEIREPELLTLKATNLAPVSCFGGLAEIQLTAGGGIKPYRYSWNFVPNDSTRRQMPAGRHIVNVTDSNGCSRNLTFVVSQPNQLQALVDSFTDARCHGENSAVLYGNYVGGQMPVRYFWRDAANRNISSDRVAKGVPAGKYRLIVVDRNNCRDTMLTTIEPKQPDPVRVKALGKVDITCNGGNNGTLWVTAEGGNGGYRYTWFTAPVMRTDSFLTNLRSGTYRVEAVDKLGCRGDTSLTIVDPPLNPIFTANDSVQICEYGTLNLQAGMNNGVIYRWIGPERSYPWGINPLRLDSVKFKKDMVFKAIGQDRNGCLDSLEVHVFVNKLPLVSIQSVPETVCYEQYAELRGIGAASYTWTRYNPYFAKMDTLGMAQRLPFTPFQRTDTGIYYVTGRLSNGCSSTTRWKMKTGLDSVLASPDTMLCAGSIYIMRARGATSYQWITPQGRVINAPSIQLNRVNRNDSGLYQLRVTDIHNCSGTYQTNLRVWKQPLVNITDYTAKEICEGQDLELSLNTDGVKFHWRGPGLDVRDQRLSQYVVKKMHPGLQGVYTAIAESPEGCVDSASMPITVNRLPDATFNFIKRCSEIITEDPVEFFANSQEKDDISWELNFVPVSTERKFTYTFDKAGTYRLKHTRVTDKGCEHFEERFLEVQDKPRIWLPTAFTPNNDFLNPVYRPVMTSTVLNYKLTVYDRWGGKRYEWRGPNTGDVTKGIWDGKINGILQPTDVYVIVVDYSTVCNENREIFTDRVSTDVMLIR